jgi:protein-disulfide isomerase
VYDLGRDPFQENIDRMQLAGQPAFGPPLAPVTLVVFSDFQCSYCKQEAEVLRQHVAQTFPREVRVVFHDFPLEQIHPWARAASIAGRCVYQQSQDKFWTYHDWVFANQQQLTVENVKQQTAGWAVANGVDAGKFQACMADAATNGEIDKLLAQGRALGVNATPTLVINGRKIPAALPWEQLQVVLREEANYQQKKAEACCSLPAPGAKK